MNIQLIRLLAILLTTLAGIIGNDLNNNKTPRQIMADCLIVISGVSIAGYIESPNKRKKDKDATNEEYSNSGPISRPHISSDSIKPVFTTGENSGRGDLRKHREGQRAAQGGRQRGQVDAGGHQDERRGPAQVDRRSQEPGESIPITKEA